APTERAPPEAAAPRPAAPRGEAPGFVPKTCSAGSAPANVHGGRWWTLRGRQKVREPPAETTQLAAKQAETQSPLTGSNRRPLLTMEVPRRYWRGPPGTRGLLSSANRTFPACS